MIISFEQLEAARWLPYLKEGGKVVVSTQMIDPMPVITGAMDYPQDLIAKMRAAGADVDGVDALAAGRAGWFCQGREHRADGTGVPLL